MKIVIVGGGKLGFYIAKTMLSKDCEVRLIEKNKARCIHLANLLDAEIICADGTEIEVLANSINGKVDCFIAATGADQDNLVAAQLAKKRFQVKKVIISANDPGNLEALRRLGMTNIVSNTEIVTKLIEQEIDSASGKLVASLNKGRVPICEFKVSTKSKLLGKPLKNIDIPKNSLVVSIVRDDELIIPQGDTVFSAGDEVIVICSGEGSSKKISKLF